MQDKFTAEELSPRDPAPLLPLCLTFSVFAVWVSVRGLAVGWITPACSSASSVASSCSRWWGSIRRASCGVRLKWQRGPEGRQTDRRTAGGKSVGVDAAQMRMQMRLF